MKKLFAFTMLCVMLCSYSAEAGGIPLVRDNKVHHYKVKMTTKVTHRKEKTLISGGSFFGPLTPKMATFIEKWEDDDRRTEYLKTQNYVTESTKWVTYINEHLGFSVEYPDILPKPMKKPADVEGIWLESSDGEIKLTVLGSYDTKSAKEMLEKISAKIKHVTILKKEHYDDWYRFIYCDEYYTIHRYGIVGDDMEAGFILGYPNEKREMFKAVTERMERTLQLGEE